MKSIKCWTCGYVIERPRQKNREVCYKCGSPFWKAPSFSWRLRRAWAAFWWTPKRKKVPPIVDSNTQDKTDTLL